MKYEYGELYKLEQFGNYCFEGSEIIEQGQGIYNLISALNALGNEGWKFILKEDDKYLLERVIGG